MRDRGILAVLLASALTFLVSLYLPWQGWHGPHGALPGDGWDGWSVEAGAAAALVALALVFAIALLLFRAQPAARWAVVSLAVALGYLAAGVALEVSAATTVRFTSDFGYPHYFWTYGSWVGLSAGGVGLLAGVALCNRDLFPRLDLAAAVAGVLGIGVLASFLLPWITSPNFGRYPGLDVPAATIAALVLLLGARWLGLRLAVFVAVLVGAATTVQASTNSPLAYGAWIGLGCAVALVVLQAFRARPWQVPAAPSGWVAVRTAAALGLLVALFLPWEEFRLSGLSSALYALNGWQELAGAAAGALALLLLAAPKLRYTVEAVAATAFLVAWIATGLGTYSGFHIAYGAYVGFGATAVLVAAALMTPRQISLSGRRALLVALPLAASVCCVGAVVVPTWNVLPESWAATAVTGWLTVAGLLIAIYLIRAWTLGGRLTLPALGLLSLPALELIRLRDSPGTLWGDWILVGLCLFLLVLGWIEERGGGLEKFRVPDEIWRIDRLPGES